MVAEQLSQNISGEKGEESFGSGEPIPIQGAEGMALDFARCCHPIPGDPISGTISTGQGMMIHKESCGSLGRQRLTPGRVIPLQWSESAKQNFIVSLRMEINNRRGALAEVALAASDAGADIEDIQVNDREGVCCLVRFELKVQNRTHLATVLRRFRSLSTVVRIERL